MGYFTKEHYFSYYRRKKINFEILKRETNINLFRDFTDLGAGKRFINLLATKFMSFFLQRFKSLPDLLAKVLPIFYIEIIWIMQKKDE